MCGEGKKLKRILETCQLFTYAKFQYTEFLKENQINFVNGSRFNSGITSVFYRIWKIEVTENYAIIRLLKFLGYSVADKVELY